MRRPLLPLALVLAASISALPLRVMAQIVSPRDGGDLPAAYRELIARDPHAFTMRHAWIEKAKKLRGERAQAMEEGSSKAAASYKVSGTYHIPIFPVTFANTSAQPYPVSDLQSELFGPSPSGYDLTEFYDEMSYGNIQASGTVYDWVALPQDDTYYEGGVNGLDPTHAKVGEIIKTCLDAYDPSVDFGLYDNDGPDGIPNSGDDDGYVDFVAFVQPEQGGECGGNDNIWSHRWVYQAWNISGNMPYQTNDPSASGGVILIDDYTIQPALSCAMGAPMVEIGVFCHEFGHAFGLPDLYDTDGGSSQGLGHWGLMAAGNWNKPDSPAHMSAWSKAELGWLTPIEVDWQGATVNIPPVETNPVAYELSFNEDRWRVRGDCALNGSKSLTVGLDNTEASARGWAAGRGYGNFWRETVAHDFHFDGTGPVSLDFAYRKDSEGGYDYTYCVLEVDSVETLLAAYDNVGSGTAAFDLTPYLGSTETDYRIKFRFVSDTGYSDEDGNYLTTCAPFVVDDIQVSGGGESYSTDFETNRSGWYQPDDALDNPISEKWLVENRQALGSESYLHGSGLAIYHVDQEVAHSYLGNDGGISNTAVRGVAMEQADGDGDLEAGLNRGDNGDIWPGISLQTTFGPASIPSSIDNSGYPTLIEVSSIAQNGNDMSATLLAGDPAPSLSGIDPSSEGNGQSVHLDLLGEENVRHGATLVLSKTGSPDIPATLNWTDYDSVDVDLNLDGAEPGQYDVVLQNPDGQNVVLAQGFEVIAVTAAPVLSAGPARMALAQNYPNPFNPTTTIRYQLDRSGPVRLVVLDVKGRIVKTLVDGSRDAGWYSVRWNGTDEHGRMVASGLYFYQMSATNYEARKKLLLLK